MDFDLRQLRHARALAEEGNFARAARTLRLTQPALSRSIQELERRTGIRLFDRAQRRVEPTDVGRVFLAHARELLAHAEAVDREVATMRGIGTGSLIVGSGTFPTAMFMTAAVSAFLRRNPHVGIRLVNDNWVALVAAMRRRELDFVVAALPAPTETEDLVTKLLAPRQARFLVRQGHPLLAKPEPALADVLAFPIVCTSRLSAGITAGLLEARNNRGATRSIPDVACESHEMMRGIAAATDHVLMSTIAANVDSVATGELVALPVVDPRLSVTFAILRLKSRTLPPIADELIADVIAADHASVRAERLQEARLLRVEDPVAPRVRSRRRGAALATAP